MTNLERWRFYLKDLESPDLFIDWTFYAMISASLQRRVAWEEWPHQCSPTCQFPNIYVIFIGPPGVGKTSAATFAKEIFKGFGGFERIEDKYKRRISIAPSSASVEQLWRYMNSNPAVVKGDALPPNPDGSKAAPYISTPLAFLCAGELGSLFRENTQDLVTFVTEGWDCGDFHRETKTQGVDFLKSMCLTLLGAATPNWVKEVSKTGLLQAGFTARTIFVYAEQQRQRKLEYVYTAEQIEQWKLLTEHIRKITDPKLYGPVRVTPEAREFFKHWYESGAWDKNRINKDESLEDYYTRKKLHIMRLSMVIHFADSTTLEVTLDDIKKAMALLARTEPDMHIALNRQSVANPSSKVARLIKERLHTDTVNGEWVNEGKLLSLVFNECDGGRVTFNEAVQFLIDCGDVNTTIRNGKSVYRLSHRKD